MLFLALLLLFSLYDISAAISQACRFLPSDDGWPTVDEWNELNKTVGGRLIAVTPGTLLGAVCHDPQFNETACEIAKTDWTEVQFQFVLSFLLLDPEYETRAYFQSFIRVTVSILIEIVKDLKFKEEYLPNCFASISIMGFVIHRCGMHFHLPNITAASEVQPNS